MMRSESTRALGQPRLTKPIFGAGGRGGSDVIARAYKGARGCRRLAARPELQFRPFADKTAEDAQPGDPIVRMTTRLERPQGLGSVLAVLAILLSLAGHASAQQAGGQAP